MSRPLESLKETANKLAHLIKNGSTDKEEICTLKRELGLIASSLEPKNSKPQNSLISNISNNPGQEERVGIWIPRWSNGKKYYIRDLKYKIEFASWAQVNEIPPKSYKKRIIYLGESVSRGFLLDPFYTPASVLETILKSKPAILEAEVVDLARTGCLIDQLLELCRSCMMLQPDIIVIFAGNNWINCFDLTEDLLEEILRIMDTEERFESLKCFLEQQYRNRIIPFMKDLDNLSKTNQVPIIFIIPEFNLQSFQSNWVQRINLWPKGETGDWLTLKDSIEEAFKKGEVERAEVLSRKIIKLNKGNPYGYEQMARCYLQRNLFTEATKYLRMALDTAIFRIMNVPCCISVVRDTILEEAARYNIPVIDLPEVFKNAQGGRPPDLNLFLDYCHLSVEGIKLAMASAAHQVLLVLAKKDIPMEILKAVALEPGEDVYARSHFFAAIHNAHRGEKPFEILLYHCRQALKKSMKVKYLMFNYIEMATRHTVWCLTKGCEKLFKSGEMDQYPFIMQPHNHYLMDIELIDAMVAALGEYGIDVAPQVSELRKKEHGFINGKINLLESYYRLKSNVASCRPNDSYYKAFAPESFFSLVTEKDIDINLGLTCRLPGKNNNEQKFCVKVNGSTISELFANNRWRNFSLKIPTNLLIDGINTIVIQWPPNIDYREINKGNHNFRETYKFKLLQQMMYPLYGEIYTFTAERNK